MYSSFDDFIRNIFLEQGEPPEKPKQDSPSPPPTQGGNEGGEEPPAPDENSDLSGDIGAEEESYPEEMELAKLAIRAIYFNISSKDVHNLKLKVEGEVIPFEKISDYFEKTKSIIPVLGFVEWVMDHYEGDSSKWTERPEFKGKGIIEKIKQMNKDLPKEQRLDNGKRVYWTRIILNCLLRGNSDFNVNISDVNENSIKEIFRLLKQNFGTDTRGLFAGTDNMQGPATF
jgi:hypothetical protein